METGGFDRHRGLVRVLLGVSLILTTLVGVPGGDGDVTAAPDDGDPLVDVAASEVDAARSMSGVDDAVAPDRARALVLNRGAMGAVLAGAPDEGSGSLTLELPAPDGSVARFAIWQTDVMAPELAARFPEITTYGGQGIDDGAATIVADLTPHGFHAQVLSPNGNWYIDPAVHLDDTYHVSFYRADNTNSPHGDFIEQHTDELDRVVAEAGPVSTDASRSGAQLRIHRLAVAANQQYTTFHGGTVASAQASIVTAINRVTGIYEVEVAIRLQLVANNSNLVFASAGGACTPGATVNVASMTGVADGIDDVLVTTASAHGMVADDIVQLAGTAGFNGKWGVSAVPSATTFRLHGTDRSNVAAGPGGTSVEWAVTTPTCDPFNNLVRDLDVNQAVVDQLIGDADYDVGHVFTTGSGGFAGTGVVGISGSKARGTTGLSTPIGDLFFVDYVAHELGHQYGGSHTWNGTDANCTPAQWGGAANAVEPGSGSTILGYAGICGLDNLQTAGQAGSGDGTNATDPYFHSHNFDQIRTHVDVTVPGAGTTSATGNNVPIANAGPDVVVPAQTPFFLTATGTDADAGDVLTYHYEQRNGGFQRDLDAPLVTSGPLFRSFPATANATSYFPRMVDVVSGNTNQNGACPVLDGATRPPADCWAQFLPQVAGPPAVGNAATLDFRATVRDNRAGGGGVDTDDAVVTVHNTGTPFAVTAPNGGGAPLSGTTAVTWNVAGTAAAPISASDVSIRLSTDGGLTYPTELLANTPNDGSEVVTLPNLDATTARLMVHSGSFAGSGFFDISDADFSIAALPTVTIDQAVGQVDPTTVSPIDFTVVFSEPVADFATGDVTLAGSAGATTATVMGAGTTYNVAVSGMTGDGTVIATVAAGVATGSGGPNVASTSTDNTVIRDTTPPVINTPTGGVTAPNDAGMAGAVVNYSVTASDGGTTSGSTGAALVLAGGISCTPASGTFFPIGVTPVACTATDQAGNATAATFNVVVNDVEKPRIADPGPRNVSISIATQPVTYALPTATDNSGPPTVVCAPPPGSVMPIGANSITCTATDRAGNAASVTFVLTVSAPILPATGGDPAGMVALALPSVLAGLALVGLSRLGRRRRRRLIAR